MIGQVVGNRYQVLESLGHGGIAVVYKAVDLQDRVYVAIKFLQAHVANDPKLVKRLLREGRTMQSLHSPHIVRLLNWGQYQGNYYLVFEYVQGETLRQHLAREGRLAPLEALQIARQVLVAMDCAWQKKIVHRDLSLNNIAQVPGGLVKVMDFGIAKNYAYEPMTRPGEALGTAYYVAPEQAQGQPVDVRSDIYALGAILYHLIAGRPPFSGTNIPAILDQHIRSNPTPLPQARPGVPPEVCRLVERAMARERGRRFQSPAEMIRAVDACREVLIHTGRTPAPRTTVKRSGKNWLGMLMLGVGVLLLALLLYLIISQAGGAHPLQLPILPTPRG